MGSAASTIPEGTKEEVRAAIIAEHEKLTAEGVPENEIEEKLKALHATLTTAAVSTSEDKAAANAAAIAELQEEKAMITAVVQSDDFPEMITRTFSEVDVDGSNDLDVSEFAKVLTQIYETGPPAVQNLKGRVTQEYVESEFRKTDTDNSGKISPSEFVVFVKKIFVQVLEDAIASLQT